MCILVITCPALTTPTNGDAPSCTDTTNHASVCTFACQTGFGLTGSADLTCGGDGSSTTGAWDQSEPTCTGEI
ncbi:MAG: hypothetical protein GY782_06100 [Gammaproteobacteria bacterium]|nr:hypothetical protein [Gammaproteobacteria bacterium]